MAKASKGRSKSLVLFGNEVKRFRQTANLSQDQTGVKVHLSGAHIGQIERGEVRCREETAEALDAALETRGTIPSLWKQCVKSAVFPTWFDWYEIEAEASHLKSYQSIVVTACSRPRSTRRLCSNTTRKPSPPGSVAKRSSAGRTRRPHASLYSCTKAFCITRSATRR